MLDIFFSVLGIYIFIAVGYLAKRTFKEQIDERTITLLSVYFLQIFLTFWGLLKRPIDGSLLLAPALYFLIVFTTLILTFFIVKKLFSDPKERSIAMVAALIGNTGNLGIPLGIAIFGEESIPYTTIINLVNVFIVYTLGVYAYSRGSFNVKDSLMNIVKLPILWAAILAISLNLIGYQPSQSVDKTLMMGAYASMTIQLLLFGIYLYDVKLQEINKLLISWVSGVKFLLLPLVAFTVLSFIEMDSMIKGILFLELMMPLAVANVNLAALYECRPRDVTALVLITSVLFLILIFGGIEIIRGYL
ncbi:MAG: AEC family transporter [Campylobacterota bacterium]|nr:AEC family transporter [Campylobacterota bacterium]